MDNGRVALTYDSAFSRGFLALDFSEPQQTLWPLFDALKSVPVIVIRGKDYDLLSEATVGEMVEQHTLCSSFAALNEAHAPLLGRERTGASIFKFIESV
ncbi:MAG: hypothetical protein KGO21_00480 [Hyphomicrobiales bacterium]|nr:hypothetical protein [Hyphomicrobiales bacterium]